MKHQTNHGGARTGSGRKPRTSPKPKTAYVCARVTPAERDKFAADAKALGITRRALMAKLINEFTPQCKPTPTQQQ